MHELDEPFDHRLRRGLQSLAATPTAPSSASVLEAAIRTRRRRRPTLLSAAVALVVALLGAVAVLALNGGHLAGGHRKSELSPGNGCDRPPGRLGADLGRAPALVR